MHALPRRSRVRKPLLFILKSRKLYYVAQGFLRTTVSTQCTVHLFFMWDGNWSRPTEKDSTNILCYDCLLFEHRSGAISIGSATLTPREWDHVWSERCLPVTWTNWDPAELISPGLRRSCVKISRGTALWKRANCDQARQYACEKTSGMCLTMAFHLHPR